MKKNIRVALSFATFPDDQLNSFAILVIACLKTNPLFPTLPVLIAALTALQAAFQAAVTATEQGGTVATAAKIEARDALVAALRQTAAYEAGDLPLAYKEFRAGADKGEADCQFNVALMYEQGIGVTKDEKEAVVWYRKSAEQGNANAQFNLGVLYEHGRGCAVDFAQANEWYRKASVQGDALAIGNLGMLYLRGDGGTTNKIAGLALLLKSATMDGSPENHAKMNIAKIKGLTQEMVATAQKLSDELGEAKNLTVPLDQFLKITPTNTVEDLKPATTNAAVNLK